MKKSQIKIWQKILIAALLGIFLAVLFTFRVSIKEMVQAFFKPDLPEAQPVTAFPPPPFSPNPSPLPTPPPPAAMPTSMNLDVPFASQAPFGDWSQPYQDACEEASIIMVHYYLTGKTLTRELMKEEILKLVEWENQTFGYYK